LATAVRRTAASWANRSSQRGAERIGLASSGANATRTSRPAETEHASQNSTRWKKALTSERRREGVAPALLSGNLLLDSPVGPLTTLIIPPWRSRRCSAGLRGLVAHPRTAHKTSVTRQRLPLDPLAATG